MSIGSTGYTTSKRPARKKRLKRSSGGAWGSKPGPGQATHEDFTARLLLDSSLTPLIEAHFGPLGVSPAQAAGLAAELQTEEDVTDMQITAAMIARWFTPAKEGRPSYADHLAAQLGPEEIGVVRGLCEQQLLGQTVAWRGVTAYIVARH